MKITAPLFAFIISISMLLTEVHGKESPPKKQVATTAKKTKKTQSSKNKSVKKAPKSITAQESKQRAIDHQNQSETVYNSKVTTQLQFSDDWVTGKNDIWDFMRKRFQFSIPDNKQVSAVKNNYLVYKASLNKTLARAEPYIYTIIHELERRKMPVELALLPLVESAFQPSAVSTTQALGLWQIMHGTAKQYSPKFSTSPWYDPRADFVESTEIALTILQSINKRFGGDWLLTLAAYNAGPGRVNKEIKKNRAKGLPTHFWALDLPKETVNYVPKLLALISMIKDNKQHNVKLPKINIANSLIQIKVNKQISLPTIAKLSGLALTDLAQFNAGHIQKITPPNGPHTIMVPISQAKKVYQSLTKNNYKMIELVKPEQFFSTTKSSPTFKRLTNFTSIASGSPEKKQFKPTRYKIKKGDTLSMIAKVHKVKVNEILEWNTMSNANRLLPGSYLNILVNR